MGVPGPPGRSLGEAWARQDRPDRAWSPAAVPPASPQRDGGGPVLASADAQPPADWRAAASWWSAWAATWLPLGSSGGS